MEWRLNHVGQMAQSVQDYSKYGEHVDDHQLQLIEQFEKLNLICPCRKLENLRNALNIVKNTKYKKYISNTKIIIKNIEQFIEKEF